MVDRYNEESGEVAKDGAQTMWMQRKDRSEVNVAPLSYEFRGGPAMEVTVRAILTSVLTLGLGVPWAQVMRYRWIAENTYVNGEPLRFTGTGGQLFRRYVLWGMLCLASFGLYAFLIPSRMRKWRTGHQTGQVSVPLS